MIKDIKADKILAEKFKSASINDIDGLIKFANTLGYKLNRDKIPLTTSAVLDGCDELRDTDLEAVVGGKGSGGNSNNVTCTSIQCGNYTTKIRQTCHEIKC